METFERRSSAQCDEPQQYQKYPLKRLEPAIRKFLKVIEIDLGRLYRHKLNVERYNKYREWNSLHTEHINATRTVQQIKANITEIEKSRLQVQAEDLQAFDKKIEPVKEKAIQSVEEFIDLAAAASKRKHHDMKTSPDRSPTDELDTSNVTLEGQSYHGNEQTQLLEDLPQNRDVVESWENLQENLEDLNSMIHQFAGLVDDQQEKVDNIENNVEKAHSSVNQGAKHLGKEAKPSEMPELRRSKRQRLSRLFEDIDTDMIERMTDEERKRILKEVAVGQPAIIIDVAAILKQREEAEPPMQPEDDNRPPAWCVCRRCPHMTRDKDKLCCGMASQYCNSIRPALNYKAAMFPVAGAVIGTIVAGPIGLVAGAKIGGVLGAVGGGTFGFVSGRFLKGRSDKVTEIELSKLSRSNSTPDIHKESQDGSWFGWSRRRNQSLSTTDGHMEVTDLKD